MVDAKTVPECDNGSRLLALKALFKAEHIELAEVDDAPLRRVRLAGDLPRRHLAIEPDGPAVSLHLPEALRLLVQPARLGPAAAVVLSGSFDGDHDHELLLTSSRRPADRFAPAVVRVLEGTPVMAQILREATEHARLARVSADRRHLLDMLSFGIVTFGADMRPAWLNRAADRMLHGGRRRTGSDTLRSRALLNLADMVSQVRQRTGRDRTLTVLRFRDSEALAGSAYGFLCRLPGEEFEADEGVQHVLFLPNPEQPGIRQPVLRAFGLTNSEARVVDLVAAGHTVRDAAGACGLTEETARTYLKRGLSKIGVPRRAQLSALILPLDLMRTDPTAAADRGGAGGAGAAHLVFAGDHD